MRRPGLIPAAMLLLAGTAAEAESCRRDAAEARAGRPCPPARRVVPYEPDRLKAGRQPGFVDLGNGTEVRIGGRVRTEYDVRR